MALVDKITAITQRAIDDTLQDNVLDSNIFFQTLKNGNRYIAQDGGTTIDQPVFFTANNQGKWYTGDDALNTTMPVMHTSAQYTWAFYDIPVVVQWTDMVKNSGAAAILSLVGIAIQCTEASMADDLGTGLFSAGTNSKQINGLRLAISTTSTVGGISQSTYSWWQAKLDSTTTVVTLHAIRNVISDCTIGKTRPNMLIGDRDMFDRVVDLVQPAQRYTDPKTAEAGFENVKVAGVPLYIDSHSSSTWISVVNTDYIKWFYSPKDNFKLFPFQMVPGQRVMIARLGLASNLSFSNLRLLGGLSALVA